MTSQARHTAPLVTTCHMVVEHNPCHMVVDEPNPCHMVVDEPNPCHMVVDEPKATKISLTVGVTFHGHEVDPDQIRGLVQDVLDELRMNGSLSVDSWYDDSTTAETSCDSVTVALASI